MLTDSVQYLIIKGTVLSVLVFYYTLPAERLQ